MPAGDGYLIPDRRDQSGLTQMYWDNEIPWENDADRGRWVKVEFHAKAASAAGVPDGALQIYKDGQSVFDRRDIDSFQQLGQNIWKTGYLLGWADSGFLQTTFAYISDVTFSTTRLP